MASDDDERKSSSPDDLSDVDSTNSSDGDSDAGEPQKVEWLATSRAKRATAGNRMKSMLANEEPAAEDSDLELLFAEDEDDAGFSEEAQDDASDVLMDSSSDEEDKEENADEMEGEKELERQAREKRTVERKRKAQEAIPVKFRKKVRIESQPAARPPRPKKKSERTSWLPSPADLPTRASERRTTKISKQQLHQKMVSDELRRRKQVERMEKKAKQLEASKKPPMTQAERLAEAAIIEKRNSKSLNRWEEAEKQREEERLRKIAALHSRKLDGPVVTFWSGIQELQEGQGKHVGNLVSMEERAPRVPRKKKQPVAAALAAKESEASTPTTPLEKPGEGDKAPETPGVKTEQPDTPTLPSTQPGPPEPPSADPSQGAPVTAASLAPGPEPEPTPASEPEPAPASTPASVPASVPTPTPVSAPALVSTTAPVSTLTPVSPPAPAPAPAPAPVVAPVSTPMAPPPIPPPPDTRPSSLGVLAAPVLAPPAGLSSSLGGQMPMLGFPAGTKPFLAAPNTSHTPSPLSMPPSTPTPTAAPQQTAPPTVSTPKPKITIPAAPPPPSTPMTPLQTPQVKSCPPSAIPRDTPQEPPASASEPVREGKVTRSCIILQNFDNNAIKDKQVQTQILFGRKMNKLAKPAHPPLCVITNHPAKYRDPKTGLPYYNDYAYREIQRVYRGDYKWSRLVGAWVGRGDYAARGVPEWFLDPSKEVKHTEPDLAPADGAAELKVKEEDKTVGEARLEPVEGVQVPDAVAPPAPETTST
ncbi:YL1 nuclear protein-domain-containing protein [Chaetomium sp. MPI-CAGE-AT-0009]|nr:YL1 nuclear protein-domain-containing protein [Chaetomium sp. MPI-CAGE-AT-0009]